MEIVKKVPTQAMEFWWPFVRVLRELYRSSFIFRENEQKTSHSEDLFEFVQN